MGKEMQEPVIPEDSRFLENCPLDLKDIARIDGIRPATILDLSLSTFTNLEQRSFEYVALLQDLFDTMSCNFTGRTEVYYASKHI